MTWLANGESGSSVRTKLNTIQNNGTSFLDEAYIVTNYGLSTSNTASQNATALSSLLSAMASAGGGIVFFPPDTSAYQIGDFTIPRDGVGTPQHQMPFRFTGANHSNGFLSQRKGSVLDLRGNSTARIVSLGAGTLEIDHLSLMNGNVGGIDAVPYILGTNTTLFLHDLTIIGDATSGGGANNLQDAIQLGGGGSTIDNTTGSAFGGYGTQITNVWVDYVKRFLYCNSGPAFTVNGIQVTNNVIWQQCGSSDSTNGSCIETVNQGASAGNYFAGNLFEGGPYKWFIRINGAGVAGNIFVGNSFFDHDVRAGGAFYRFEGSTSNNLIIHAFQSSTQTIMSNAGTNNILITTNGADGSGKFSIQGLPTSDPGGGGIWLSSGAMRIG